MHFKLELILRSDFEKQFELSLEEPDFPGLVLTLSGVSDEKDRCHGSGLCAVSTDIAPPPKIAELLHSSPEQFPKEVQNFADDLEGRLWDVAEKALKMLRWFRGCYDGQNPIGAFK